MYLTFRNYVKYNNYMTTRPNTILKSILFVVLIDWEKLSNEGNNKNQKLHTAAKRCDVNNNMCKYLYSLRSIIF